MKDSAGSISGDFDLPPKAGKISHALMTKAIFRGPLIFLQMGLVKELVL